MGRPSKLTPELADSIVSLMSHSGISMETIAMAVEIDISTLYNWMKWGKDQDSGPYFELFNRVTRAKAKRIQDAAATALDTFVNGGTETITTWRQKVIEQADGSHKIVTYKDKEVVRQLPPDGRGIMEYLSRIDRKHWSKTLGIETPPSESKSKDNWFNTLPLDTRIALLDHLELQESEDTKNE